MINDEDIVFVTTTLSTKWLGYQSKIIKDLFPNSDHILIDGRSNWPNVWFNWIDAIKKKDSKYYIHIDEDFFITSKEELIKAIEKLETEKLDLIGTPDGYSEYRGANPVAMNSFFMIGKVDSLKKLDFEFGKLMFNYSFDGTNYNSINNFNLKFKEDYLIDFKYDFDIRGGANFSVEQEPYYLFFWLMKDLGMKFGYLYPHFDDYFKSTNPRVDMVSNNIGIHAWYTRNWDQTFEVHGVPNVERYLRIEYHLKQLYDL